MSETVFTNARIVLDETVLHGHLVMRDGRIAAIGEGPARGLDCDGDTLMPGIVDLHTDNLERQVLPRAHARWPSRSAMFAHDAQCAAAGVTTVLDAFCVGNFGYEPERVRTFREGVADLEALAGTDLLRAEHFLHLRCEIPAPDMQDLLAPYVAHPALRLVSLMDHTPGFGQYADLDQFRAKRRHEGMTDAAIEARISENQARREAWSEPNRRALLATVRHVRLASHDDRTEQEVARNHADGIAISEFPVTAVAAEAAARCGMQVIAGAPNLVRGGSHTGNVAASDLIAAGRVDAFASDYVPASMIEAAFLCADRLGLPAAIALVTSRPAAMAGLDDRGRFAPGLRADCLRVRLHEDQPIVRAVWRTGERVA